MTLWVIGLTVNPKRRRARPPHSLTDRERWGVWTVTHCGWHLQPASSQVRLKVHSHCKRERWENCDLYLRPFFFVAFIAEICLFSLKMKVNVVCVWMGQFCLFLFPNWRPEMGFESEFQSPSYWYSSVTVKLPYTTFNIPYYTLWWQNTNTAQRCNRRMTGIPTCQP